MSNIDQLYVLFREFQTQANAVNAEQANEKLKELKKHFTSLNTFLNPVANPTEEEKKEIILELNNLFCKLVGETLETAILFASKVKDMESFERHMKQVRTYYRYNSKNSLLTDDSSESYVEKSPKQGLIVGLNLLRLLAQNRIAEFHTELELIPIESRTNMYIKQPIELEMDLMEGSFNKVRKAMDKVPAPEYLIFMEELMKTVRREFADCSEHAYQTLKISNATKLLSFKSDKETLEFIKERNWMVEEGVIRFDKMAAKKRSEEILEEKERNDFLKRTLGYAKEIERIV